MNQYTAQQILKVRDALVDRDLDEAYHQLYTLADPEYKIRTNPWEDVERIAATPSPAKAEQELRPIKPLGDWLLAQKDLPPVMLPDGGYWYYGSVLQLLKRYKSDPESTTPPVKEAAQPAPSGLRWVKASERTPVNAYDNLDPRNKVHTKYTEKSGWVTIGAGNFFVDGDDVLCDIGNNHVVQYQFENLLWLDESPSLPVTEPFTGSSFSQPAPGITLGCISPEARNLLDTIMAAWEPHYAALPKEPKPSFYGFAYWLVRWSGLIQPPVKEQAVDPEPLELPLWTEIHVQEIETGKKVYWTKHPHFKTTCYDCDLIAVIKEARKLFTPQSLTNAQP